MTRLSLRTFGGFEALLNGRRLTNFGYDKVRALLVYLAVERAQSHARQSLAGLLWPEQDEDHARQSLRQALNSLRSLLGDRTRAVPILLVSRDAISFNANSQHDIDAAAFDAWKEADRQPDAVKVRANCRGQYLQVAAHYRGPFLAGFSLPDAPEFESWLQFKREWFDRLASELFQRLAACHEQTGEYDAALKYAHSQLHVDPWNEEAHQQVMRLLVFNGQRNAAISHFHQCRQLLAADLGVEPSYQTRKLYEQMCGGMVERAVGLPVELLVRVEPSESRPCNGAPSGHAGERRLLTVLSCELRDALSDDPEDLQERLGDFYRIGIALVRRYGGHVVEQDNGVLTAYFGYPHLCEDAARQATRAACALVKYLKMPFEPRIRIHTGIVLAPPEVRGACSGGASVVGSVPKVARAMHALAVDADLAISAATFGVVRDTVVWANLGKYGLADYPRPLEMYEVYEHLDEMQRLEQLADGPSAGLIGREAEFAVLAGHWRQAQAGAGHALLVAGEQGMGKSALTAALWERARSEGRRLVTACAPHTVDWPFSPMNAVLKQLFECPTDAGRDTCLLRLEAGLGQWQMADAMPLLAPLLTTDDIPDDRSVDSERRQALRQQLLRLFERVSHKEPVLLVIEDLHWADVDTLGLLDELMRSLPRHRLLLVMTTRQDWAVPWQAGPALKRLQLAPLNMHQIGMLLRAHFPEGCETGFAEATARCEGLPAFALALARGLRGYDGHDEPRERGPLVPIQFVESLGMTLDRLGPAKTLVQLASSIGSEFPEEVLLRSLERLRNLGLEPATLADVLARLVALGIFESWNTANGVRYGFRRAMLRDAAYRSQPRRQQHLFADIIAEVQHPLPLAAV